jgi:predicted SAM-dependent methyltransferase
MKEIIKDGTVDEIYACHVLEHFPRKKILATIREWNRVLKPGGKLRIAVPDFGAMTKFYLKEGSLHKLYGMLFGGQRDELDFHMVTFDYQLLSSTLQDCGFTDTQHYNWEDFLPENYDDYSKCYLPHMDPNGILLSLNIVTTKLSKPLDTPRNEVRWAFGDYRPWK